MLHQPAGYGLALRPVHQGISRIRNTYNIPSSPHTPRVSRFKCFRRDEPKRASGHEKPDNGGMPSGRRRGNLASTDSPFPTTQVCAGDRRRHPGRAGLVSNPPGPGRPAGNGPAGNGEGRAGPDRRRIVSRGGRVAGEDGPEAGDPGLYLRVCVCV